ncbi:MAG: hypothetical protein ABFS34_05695 [Gemmatimonadota bacterium]
MTGHHPWSEIKAKMSPERRRRAEVRTEILRTEIRSLRRIRRRLGIRPKGYDETYVDSKGNEWNVGWGRVGLSKEPAPAWTVLFFILDSNEYTWGTTPDLWTRLSDEQKALALLAAKETNDVRTLTAWLPIEWEGYKGEFCWDDGAGHFHGHVLLPKAVITFVSKDPEKLVDEMAESMRVYLEMCAEDGVEPEPPENSLAQKDSP